MKAQFYAHFRPRVSVTDVHIRYEQFDTVSEAHGKTVPFSLGMMIKSFDVSTTIAQLENGTATNKVGDAPVGRGGADGWVRGCWVRGWA